MTFDNNRVYTAVNADELKIGSKVIAADTFGHLKQCVLKNDKPEKLVEILDEYAQYRFKVNSRCNNTNEFAFAYLVEEPERLKWTDLKVGDVITDGKMKLMVTAVSTVSSLHIYAGLSWLTDKELEEWEKVNE